MLSRRTTKTGKTVAVARPAIMPHVSSSGGGDDLGSEDEVKVFKDEGEDEKRSSENLTEEKSSLIDLTESEVRRFKKKYIYICIDIINESFNSATLFISRTKLVCMVQCVLSYFSSFDRRVQRNASLV